MAKRSKDVDVDFLIEDWIGINRQEDATAWEAWISWRHNQLGCLSRPENLTVPTPFPPSTINGAREYVAILQQIRGAIGWKAMAAKLPSNYSAYMGS